MDEKDGRVNIFEETMAHLTYVQIERAAEEGTPVLFPVGVIEEHGPHLPLAVDVYGSYLQSRIIRSELEKKGVSVLIAPPFYWGSISQLVRLAAPSLRERRRSFRSSSMPWPV